MNRNNREPILVLWDSETQHRLSGYLTEILHVEGYNWFAVHDLAHEPVTPALLTAYPTVILTHVEPSEETQRQLLDFLQQGGDLIALRPPESLAEALGLTPAGRDLVDRYIAFNSLCAINSGVDLPPLQFHGKAELYNWSREPSNVLAHFAAFPDYITAHPAITVGTLGQGRWAVFAYDLAESTVLFHQGRREQSSTGSLPDADGDRMYKPNDLFVSYLDPELCYLPQADLHQDALVRILEWMASLRQPLPRVWHFPRGARAAAFINGDGDNMSTQDLANTVATAERFGVPYTTYLMMQDHPKVTPEWERALRDRGHDFGQHAFAGLLPTPVEMRARLKEEMAAFRSRYGHEPVTYRGHSLVWVGWTDMAKYLRENGVRLDTNFAAGRFHGRGSYVNSSGLPVKFMDEDGVLLDIYEQATISTDDGLTTDKRFARPLTIDECIAFSKRQADEAMDTYHTVYHPYFHPARTRPGPMSTQRWLEGILRHCTERGFHFVNGVDWLNFNDGRRSLRLVEYGWDSDAGTLDLALETEIAVEGATLALPYLFEGKTLARATVDGEPVPVTPQTLEGRPQVLLPADYSAAELKRWRIRWDAGAGAT